MLSQLTKGGALSQLTVGGALSKLIEPQAAHQSYQAFRVQSQVRRHSGQKPTKLSAAAAQPGVHT